MESIHSTQNWLASLSTPKELFLKGKKPTIALQHALFDALKRPENSFKHRIIVGGTAGKGTVCALCEDILLREGKTTVLLNSPSLTGICGHIRINGKDITEEEFWIHAAIVKDICEKNNIEPSQYEVIVTAGVLAGVANKCEVFIGEIGLGGEGDSVNAVQGDRIAALTFVGEDHLDILGPTLEDVARTKAGIFTKDTVYALTYEQKYYSILNSMSSVDIELIKGVSTKLNKKIARKICKKILGHSDFEMKKVQLPARWESFVIPACPESDKSGTNIKTSKNRTVILDGAHSKPRFEFLVPKLQKLSSKPTAIIGLTRNHDPEMIRIILPYVENIIWTTGSAQRQFWQPEELQKHFGVGECEPDPIKALENLCHSELAEESPSKILVTGSFFLCELIREKLV